MPVSLRAQGPERGPAPVPGRGYEPARGRRRGSAPGGRGRALTSPAWPSASSASTTRRPSGSSRPASRPRRAPSASSAPTATSATPCRSAASSPTATTSAPRASGSTSAAATSPSAPASRHDQVAADLPRVMDEICRAHLVRRRAAATAAPPTTRSSTRSATADFAPQRELRRPGRQAARHRRRGQPLRRPVRDEDDDRVWVGVHFGSRGFGHKTASGFLALAQGRPFDGRAHEGEM